MSLTKHMEYINKNPILKKSFEFGVAIIKLSKNIRVKYREYSLADQLLRSGTSIGANANEAVIGSSKKDFINKMSISHKEARETYYWLSLLIKTNYLDSNTILKVCEEIIKIITSILKTARIK